MPTFAEAAEQRRGLQQEDEDLDWRLRLAAQRLKAMRTLQGQRQTLEGQLERQGREHGLRREMAAGTQKRHEDVMGLRRQQAEDYKTRSDRAYGQVEKQFGFRQKQWGDTLKKWTAEATTATQKAELDRKKADYDFTKSEWDRAFSSLKSLRDQKLALMKADQDTGDGGIQQEALAVDKQIATAKEQFRKIDQNMQQFVNPMTPEAPEAAQPPAEAEGPGFFGDIETRLQEHEGEEVTPELADEMVKHYGSAAAAMKKAKELGMKF